MSCTPSSLLSAYPATLTGQLDKPHRIALKVWLMSYAANAHSPANSQYQTPSVLAAAVSSFASQQLYQLEQMDVATALSEATSQSLLTGNPNLPLTDSQLLANANDLCNRLDITGLRAAETFLRCLIAS